MILLMAYNIIIPHTAFESKDDHPLLGPLELDWTYLQIRSLTESPRRGSKKKAIAGEEK